MIALTAILLVAAFLRTYNLLALPIFADEAIYVRWAQVMRAETTLRFLPLSDGKIAVFNNARELCGIVIDHLSPILNIWHAPLTQSFVEDFDIFTV